MPSNDGSRSLQLDATLEFLDTSAARASLTGSLVGGGGPRTRMAGERGLTDIGEGAALLDRASSIRHPLSTIWSPRGCTDPTG